MDKTNEVDTIEEMNLEQLKIAIEKQNNELLGQMFDVILQQQVKIEHLYQMSKKSQESIGGIVNVIGKIVAKVEVLHQFIKKNA